MSDAKDELDELNAITLFMESHGWALHYMGWADDLMSNKCTYFTKKDLDSIDMTICSEGEVTVRVMIFNGEPTEFKFASRTTHDTLQLSGPNFFHDLLKLMERNYD